MPLLICQNCGNHQNDGSVCRKCSMPLFGHPSAAGSGTEKRLTLPPVDSKRGRSIFRLVYRIANYATIVLLVVVVVLILHKPQPPQVTADPQKTANLHDCEQHAILADKQIVEIAATLAVPRVNEPHLLSSLSHGAMH